jgi:hypothetical protein
MRLILSLFLVPLALAATPAATAQQSATPAAPTGPLAGVYACAEIAGTAERLACYDAAVGRLRTAETTGEVAVLDAERVQTVQREAFGFSMPSLPRLRLPGGGGERVETVTLEIASVSSSGDGRSTLRFTNGQVWRQVEADRIRGAVPGAQVRISQGALGSFNATIVGRNGLFKVRRQE